MAITINSKFQALAAGGSGVAGVGEEIDASDVQTLVENTTHLHTHLARRALLAYHPRFALNGTDSSYTEVFNACARLSSGRTALRLRARAPDTHIKLDVYESDGTTLIDSVESTSEPSHNETLTGLTSTNVVLSVSVKLVGGGVSAWSIDALDIREEPIASL